MLKGEHDPQPRAGSTPACGGSCLRPSFLRHKAGKLALTSLSAATRSFQTALAAFRRPWSVILARRYPFSIVSRCERETAIIHGLENGVGVLIGVGRNLD